MHPMRTTARALLLAVLASTFTAGCVNSTRVKRSPDNHHALRAETLVVEQKATVVDATKPGVLGPFEPFVVFAIQLLGNGP
jgi:hypothetical protein